MSNTHPLSNPTPRIDICQGGMQADVIKDSLALARHAVRELDAGEHILILNSLCSNALLERTARQISSHQKGSVITMSASGAKLRERIDFLTTVVKERKVRMLIVNCWEFAAYNAGQKQALAMWIRELRDEHGVRTVIYTIEAERPRNGALMLLAWLADRVLPTGKWDEAQEKISGVTTRNSNDALTDYLAENPEPELDADDDTRDLEQSWLTYQAINRRTRNQLLSGQPLKTNDLTPVLEEV